MAGITNFEAAMGYARIGLAVLPLKSGARIPSEVLGKKLPTEVAVAKATWDKPWLMRWWKEEPHANIGVATGVAKSNVVAIVIKDSMFLDGKDTSSAVCVDAPNGSRIYCWKIPKKQKFKSGEHEGIFVVCENGYIPAPPSTVGGASYNFAQGDFSSLAPAPDWLIEWEAKRNAKNAEEEGGAE